MKKKNNWPIKGADMTANMQDYNNPQLPRPNGRGKRGDAIPNKPVTKRSTNHTVKLKPSCT